VDRTSASTTTATTVNSTAVAAATVCRPATDETGRVAGPAIAPYAAMPMAPPACRAVLFVRR
jgi:hypothetical protein